ncbi:MAG: ABC transporter ATP-binding protein [Gemmatimonadota bacterium]
MITGRAVTKRYGDQLVLDALDFHVERGERVALLGLNGAGKTTLLRCLLGLVSFEGELTVDRLSAGAGGAEGKGVRGRIGYVPQQPPRFDLTLTEFVDLFSRLRGVPAEGPADFLERLGMPLDRTGRKLLRELSGGMLQKALLAMSLGAGVPVLLLDEPTASLDASARADFLAALREAPAESTLLFASHRVEDVQALADRVLLLEEGRLAFDGRVDEMIRRAGALRSAGGAPPGPPGQAPLLLGDILEGVLRGRLGPRLAAPPRVALAHGAGGAR